MRDESQRWQQILATGFSTAAELLNFLEIPSHSWSYAAEQQFATRVPIGFAQRMQKGNPHDPLLLQVLASPKEISSVEGFTRDPLNEVETNKYPGLIHKYEGRVLLTVTGICAINCRYCFRRHFPYQANNPGRAGWRDTLQYIAQDPTLHEVIFSGGDPLLASDETLRFLIETIKTMPHIKTLRIHTRVPVVLPERINHDLCQLLNQASLQVIVVLHVNHPNELSEAVSDACQKLRNVNVHLLNQSVLLNQVNDTVEILVHLSKRLFACGILPYYIHMLDKVQGAAHFEVTEAHAIQLMQSITQQLPGYLVPRLAREIAGRQSKTFLY